LKRLKCRRTGEFVTPEEHERCPYCYGRISDVKTGDYDHFCDFHEGDDPLTFGFPDDSSRQQHG